MQTRKQEEIDRCIKFGEALNPFKLIIDVAKLILGICGNNKT